MIQLKSKAEKILFEREESEKFPDYRAVLIEAISKDIDLNGLRARRENLDNITWKGLHLASLYFDECSLQNNTFENCTIEKLNISFSKCSGMKCENCSLNGLWENSDFKNSVFLNLDLFGQFHSIMECNLKNVRFSNSDLYATGFHISNLSHAIFEECNLDYSSFVPARKEKELLDDTLFLKCSMKGSEFHKVGDIAQIYFWETAIWDIDFSFTYGVDGLEIVKVENNNSTVVYCVDKDVLWWKPYSWVDEPYRIFRSTLQGFIEEVENDFPTTDLYPLMWDIQIAVELDPVCDYLKFLRDRFK